MTRSEIPRSAHCIAGGHKQCHGRRLGRREGHPWNTLVPCECPCHEGGGTREIDLLRDEVQRLRQEAEQLRQEIQRLLADNAELSAECDQWCEKAASLWRDLADLRARLESKA